MRASTNDLPAYLLAHPTKNETITITFDDKVQVELLIEALCLAIEKSNGPKATNDYRDLKNNIVLQTSKLNLFASQK